MYYTRLPKRNLSRLQTLGMRSVRKMSMMAQKHHMLDPPRARIASNTRGPVSLTGVTFLIDDAALVGLHS
jgi:hypothetical protein